MYFFEKHKKMSIIIGTALVILIVMGISVLAGGTFFAENLFNTVVSPIQNGITAVTDGVGGFFNFLFEMKDYKEEEHAPVKACCRAGTRAKERAGL